MPLSRSGFTHRIEEDEQGPHLSGQKSPDAFRTISEVATELDVPQHVLRFWESKFNQIRPLKRGGGRRDYRPGDEQGVKFVSETGRGTVDTSLAELAREAVERGEQEEREGPAKPVSASGRKRLEVLLEDLISLKDEIDETLWESEDEES